MSAETLLAIEAKIEVLQEDIQFLRVELQSQGEQIQELKTSRDAEGVKSKAAVTNMKENSTLKLTQVHWTSFYCEIARYWYCGDGKRVKVCL